MIGATSLAKVTAVVGPAAIKETAPKIDRQRKVTNVRIIASRLTRLRTVFAGEIAELRSIAAYCQKIVLTTNDCGVTLKLVRSRSALDDSDRRRLRWASQSQTTDRPEV